MDRRALDVAVAVSEDVADDFIQLGVVGRDAAVEVEAERLADIGIGLGRDVLPVVEVREGAVEAGVRGGDAVHPRGAGPVAQAQFAPAPALESPEVIAVVRHLERRVELAQRVLHGLTPSHGH